jgi:putative two-component system response regulator
MGNAMKILIVDDDDIAREMLRHTLARAGYEVTAAADGREALEILRGGSYRMVISDWVMPDIDGIALCRAIRSGDFPGYIYIVLLTSRDQTGDIVEGLSAEADDFIRKPFHPAELLVRVRAGERVLALETRDLAIFAMAKLAESRDQETGAHLERMRRYSRVLAQELLQRRAFRGVVDADYVRMIYQTSPLHDIGKVGIPDRVLLKAGPLSGEEYEVMKRHTVIGAQTISAALRQHPEAKFLHLAKDIILTHHERFDGSGYPAGLAGPEIPLCGRIVALADVYDALTTKRVYKDAFSHEVARSIILDLSGRQFDPEIVAAFLRAEGEFLAIRDKYLVDRQSSYPSCPREEAIPLEVG